MKHLIGIDPSFTNFGLAIRDMATGELFLKTGTLRAMMDYLMEQEDVMESCGIVIEDPNMESRFFGASMIEQNLIKYKAGQIGNSEMKQMIRIAFAGAQDVGKSKAAATLIIELLQDFPLLRVDPSKRQRADKGKTDPRYLIMPTKTTAAQFYELCKYEHRCSEHARDAATLILNRTATAFETSRRIQKAEQDRIEQDRKEAAKQKAKETAAAKKAAGIT
jgi:hypothetical protein